MDRGILSPAGIHPLASVWRWWCSQLRRLTYLNSLHLLYCWPDYFHLPSHGWIPTHIIPAWLYPWHDLGHDISMWNLPQSFQNGSFMNWLDFAESQTDSLVWVVLLGHMKSCSTGPTTMLRKFLRTFMLIFYYQQLWHKNTRSALSLMESIRGNFWCHQSHKKTQSILCREWLWQKAMVWEQLVLACVWSASKLSKYLGGGYTQINIFC